MRLKKQRPAAASSPQETTKPTKPAWQELADQPERSSREDLASAHDAFIDSALEPVALPRWVRGRRRSQREKRSRP